MRRRTHYWQSALRGLIAYLFRCCGARPVLGALLRIKEARLIGRSTGGHNKRGNACINVSFRRVRDNRFCRAKARGITYSEFVSIALVIQHAKRMDRIMLSYVPYLVLPYFSILSHKWYDFRGKKLLHIIKCFYFIYNFFSLETWSIGGSRAKGCGGGERGGKYDLNYSLASLKGKII